MAESALRNLFPSARDRILSQQGQMPAAPAQQSMSMVDRARRFASLDTPQDMSLGETIADIGMGFAPGIGTAQGVRDFERARRDDDLLGMALGGISVLPLAGGLVKAGRAAGEIVEGFGDAASRAVRSDPLDMSAEARMQRAAEQGFDTSRPLYHGTDKEFEEFVTKKGLSGKASYFTPDPEVASAYAMGDVRFKRRGPSATVMPVYLRGNMLDLNNLTRQQEIDIWKEIEGYELTKAKPGTLKYEMLTDNKFPSMSQSLSDLADEEYVPDYVQMMEKLNELNMTDKILQKLGYAGVRGSEVLYKPRNMVGDKEYESIAIFDPSNIRSVNAAFDPANRRSANILATAAGGTIGLSALRQLMPQEERPIE